jgi:hypothetical protein
MAQKSPLDEPFDAGTPVDRNQEFARVAVPCPAALEAEYREMAADRAREQAALEWSEGALASVASVK